MWLSAIIIGAIIGALSGVFLNYAGYGALPSFVGGYAVALVSVFVLAWWDAGE